MAANNIHALTWLARKGTNIWLIPKAFVVPDPAEPTPVTAGEFYDTAIPLGETLQPSDTIRAVLDHTGTPPPDPLTARPSATRTADSQKPTGS